MKKKLVRCLLPIFAFTQCLQAAVITSVPMGGSMIHANILYDASASRIDVHVEPVIPQLCPLDMTNPADNFAPDDPWFCCLDPSEEGNAFNRQYGLVMDAGTDPVPTTMGIWVRLISADPELAFYRYRSSAAGKSWEPIFGTAGSTNVLNWNLSMFHPAVAAVAGNRTNSAEFEAFAVDLASGQRNTQIASGRFTLVWTVAPSARPVPQLTPDLVLSWAPVAGVDYIAQSTDKPVGGTWTDLASTPVLQDGKLSIQLVPATQPQFYRLKRTP